MKPYNQYCPIAHALDVVGERWSLLVVRELIHGPLRYSDLQNRLTGCSTNVLADRLRGLEAEGVIHKRRLPPPAGSMVYELTKAGERLAPVLAELARWGARTLGAPPADARLDDGWLERALRIAVASSASDVRVAFRCGAETASLIDGVVAPGVAADAAATVDCDPAGFYHLVVDGQLEGITIAGDEQSVRRLAAATASPA